MDKVYLGDVEDGNSFEPSFGKTEVSAGTAITHIPPTDYELMKNLIV